MESLLIFISSQIACVCVHARECEYVCVSMSVCVLECAYMHILEIEPLGKNSTVKLNYLQLFF